VREQLDKIRGIVVRVLVCQGGRTIPCPISSMQLISVFICYS
jgi:hypothetical protein